MSKTSEISSRRITLKDVAAHAGIGYPSVSAVLNGSKGQHVAMETRERILRAAEELGYRRNASKQPCRKHYARQWWTACLLTILIRFQSLQRS
jgi:DNA-binding LacI/PurR family transcriptional regulator